MSQFIPFKSDYIDSIKLTNLPNAAHGEFNHDVLEKAKETEAIVQNIARPLSIYEAAVQRETQASYKDMSDSITKRINEELVPTRNGIETGYKAMLRAQMESDDQAVAAAAKMLTELAHLHHMHTDLKLNSQTDAIRDYISDVEANHMEALELTVATVLFNKLKAINDEVCAAVMERTEIDAKRVLGEMLKARGETDDAFRGLNHCIAAQIYMNQSLEPYSNYILFTNQLIKDYKRIYFKDTESNGNGSTGEGGGDGSGDGSGDGDEGDENGGSDNNPSNPNNPNNPSNPGSGSGSGNDNQEPTLVTMLYLYHDNTEDTRRGEPGTRLVSPEPDAGYEWQPTPPNVFPDTDRTFTEVEIEDNGEGDGDDDAGFGR